MLAESSDSSFIEFSPSFSWPAGRTARIGEGDVLSELSKKEQGVGGPPTKQETLDL